MNPDKTKNLNTVTVKDAETNEIVVHYDVNSSRVYMTKAAAKIIESSIGSPIHFDEAATKFADKIVINLEEWNQADLTYLWGNLDKVEDGSLYVNNWTIVSLEKK